MNNSQYPETVSQKDLQIWDNAAFDTGDSPVFVKPVSVDSLTSKENISPLVNLKPNSHSIKRIYSNVKPLKTNSLIVNSQGNPIKVLIKPSFVENEVRDEKKIDSEIEEVVSEISRLSKKLDELKIEKAEQKLKMLEKKGRFVPAKFLEQKGVKFADGVKKVEEMEKNLFSSAKTRLMRRGVSMGPSEFIAKSRQIGKIDVTPVQSAQNRRKSCYWKLQEIDELKVIKERGKSSSVSPKSRKAIPKTPFSRQAVTTLGSKKGVKKEDILQIQPKKLFGDGGKSAPVKKNMKPGRVVASRYNNQGSVNSANVNSAIRKRSLPDNDKDEIKRFDKKRASSSTGSSVGSLPEIGLSKGKEGTENRMKKRWDVKGEIVLHSSIEDEDITPVSALKVPAILPRIRTMRGMVESPRDSGPAKRVSELIGRKSYFCDDENEELEVCHELDFAEDDE